MNFSEDYLTNSNKRIKELDVKIRQYEPVNGKTMPSIDQLAVGEGRIFSLAVLFADLVDSTNTINSLQLNQASRWLLHFLIESTKIIKDFGGEVEKYSGDRVLGLFGTNGGSTFDIAQSAIYCGLAIRCVVNKVLKPFYASKGLPKVQVKIGIDYGLVQIDKVGIRGNSELSAIGTMVNIASKLENIAAPNQILLGESLFSVSGPDEQKFCEQQTPSEDFTYRQRNTDKPYKYYSFGANFSICRE